MKYVHVAIMIAFLALVPAAARAQADGTGCPDNWPSMIGFVDLPKIGPIGFNQGDKVEPLPDPDRAEPRPTEQNSQGLTLAQLEHMALCHNPTLAFARAKVRAARGHWLQEGLYPNPTIGYSGEEMGDEGTSGKQGGLVGQEIVTAGKLRLNRAVAAREIAKLEQEVAAQQFRVLTDVRIHFHDVLVDQAKIELIKQLVKIGEEGVRAAEALFKAKEASRVDLLQARVEVDSTRILLVNALSDHESTWRGLTAVLGCPDMPMARLVGNVEDPGSPLEWEAALGRVLSESPELAAARAEVSRRRWAIQQACAERIPNIGLETSVHKDNVTDSTIAAVQIDMPLVIFNRNQGNIAAANSNLTAACRNFERIRLELRRRLAETFNRYSRTRNQVEQYKSAIIPNARESLDMIVVGYQQGEFDYLSLLTAQRTYFRSNLAYIEALKELKVAVAEIEGLLLKDSLAARE